MPRKSKSTASPLRTCTPFAEVCYVHGHHDLGVAASPSGIATSLSSPPVVYEAMRRTRTKRIAPTLAEDDDRPPPATKRTAPLSRVDERTMMYTNMSSTNSSCDESHDPMVLPNVCYEPITSEHADLSSNVLPIVPDRGEEEEE